MGSDLHTSHLLFTVTRPERKPIPAAPYECGRDNLICTRSFCWWKRKNKGLLSKRNLEQLNTYFILILINLLCHGDPLHSPQLRSKLISYCKGVEKGHLFLLLGDRMYSFKQRGKPDWQRQRFSSRGHALPYLFTEMRYSGILMVLKNPFSS